MGSAEAITARPSHRKGLWILFIMVTGFKNSGSPYNLILLTADYAVIGMVSQREKQILPLAFWAGSLLDDR